MAVLQKASILLYHHYSELLASSQQLVGAARTHVWGQAPVRATQTTL